MNSSLIATVPAFRRYLFVPIGCLSETTSSLQAKHIAEIFGVFHGASPSVTNRKQLFTSPSIGKSASRAFPVFLSNASFGDRGLVLNCATFFAPPRLLPFLLAFEPPPSLSSSSSSSSSSLLKLSSSSSSSSASETPSRDNPDDFAHVSAPCASKSSPLPSSSVSVVVVRSLSRSLACRVVGNDENIIRMRRRR